MDRRRAEWALLAVVAIVALAAAAATLPSATPTDGAGVGPGTGGTADRGQDPTRDPLHVPGFEFSVLRPLLVAIALLALLAAIVYAVLRGRAVLGTVLTLGGLVGLAALLLWLLLAPAVGGAATMGSLIPPFVSPSGGGGGPVPFPTVALLVALGAILAVLLLRRHGVPGRDRSDAGGTGDRVADVGRAAGRAADRIEATAEPENEVYRAWHEMTDHLSVDRPAASTPGEFAAAATQAGMRPADVNALTRLFEDVRYGGAAPTPLAEGRALSILRRIEAAYADGEAAEG